MQTLYSIHSIHQPGVIKIDPFNFELYRFKVGCVFLRHSVELNINLVNTCDYFNHALINASIRQVYLYCMLPSTTRLFYKMQPPSNLPSNNFINLSTKNCYSCAATAT